MHTKTRSFIYFFAICSLALSTPVLSCVYAEDDVSIEGIRRELREAAAKAATQGEIPVQAENSTSEASEFSFSEKDLEVANKELAEAEAALLKKLDGGPTSSDSGSASADTQAMATKSQTQLALEAVNPVVVPALIPEPAIAKDLDKDTAVVPSVPAVVEANAALGSMKPSNTIGSSRSKDPKETVIRDQIQEIAALRKNNADLSKKLLKAEGTLVSSQKKLSEAQNRLMLAETEVERLSSVIDSRNRATAQKVGGGAVAATAPMASRASPPRSEDVPVITVVADKANLRTGPGAENSPLMAISKGTRLVVEKREGEWYRVVTPSGTRAWISAEVVAFGASPQTSPSGALRIKGYDAALEGAERAFGRSSAE
jgi:hypothetical protein